MKIPDLTRILILNLAVLIVALSLENQEHRELLTLMWFVLSVFRLLPKW